MLVSIVIPTLNAGPAFGETLDAIFEQRMDCDVEVIVIDSGSADGTVELARRYPVRLLQIPPEYFGHGRTRNLGVSHAQGELVVLLVQDAVPANHTWLKNLILPFDGDDGLAGVYSRQIPRPEADFFTRRMYSIWGVSSEQPRTVQIDDQSAYDGLSWEQKAHVCAFSNVSSAIRRSIWKEIPFPEIGYAEDLAWAKAALEQGYRLLYCPDSTVVHSHHRSWREKLRRAYTEGKVVPKIFEADVAFPGDSALKAMADLLYEELQRGGERMASTPLSESAFVEALPTGSIRCILSETSPWMSGAPRERKRKVLLNELVSETVGTRQRGASLDRALVTVWLKLLCAPGIDQVFHVAFKQRYAGVLMRMWEDSILFWAILSTYANEPLPVDVTNQLLNYFGEFLPAPKEELPSVWLNVLTGVIGKRLGVAAHAAPCCDEESRTVQRIEKWIMERPQPQA